MQKLSLENLRPQTPQADTTNQLNNIGLVWGDIEFKSFSKKKSGDPLCTILERMPNKRIKFCPNHVFQICDRIFRPKIGSQVF